jgi:hypothetical protein
MIPISQFFNVEAFITFAFGKASKDFIIKADG